MNKHDAQIQLKHNFTTAMLTLGAIEVLNSDSILTLENKSVLIKEEKIIFNPNPLDFNAWKYHFDFNQVIANYQNDREKHVVSVMELYKSMRRALIKESYEVLKSYAKKTNQSLKLEQANWYRFATIIRNAITHDFHFEFSKYDLNAMPLTWKNVMIDCSLKGNPISDEQLPHGVSFDLHMEMNDFLNQMD